MIFCHVSLSSFIFLSQQAVMIGLFKRLEQSGLSIAIMAVAAMIARLSFIRKLLLPS
ncbi:hypothetical protein [Nitrosomonas nitrosa]|uniref:hypothetical protein n=1 Tax=Nitrosomonas nitrosa TaxID=52442 RepID=UPI0015E6BE28|nr:hypothetical protein [Nitrosomonas nitrosa]